MNPRQRAHFRRILEDWKAELSQDNRPHGAHHAGRGDCVRRPQRPCEPGIDIALELRNRDRERKLIKKIDETIARSMLTTMATAKAVALRLASNASRPARRHAMHRLQDARRDAREASRQVTPGNQPAPVPEISRRANWKPLGNFELTCRVEAICPNPFPLTRSRPNSVK